jgi:hypothetical protein
MFAISREKRVISVAEFGGGYLRGTVKRKHHLSRMTPPTENVVVSERSDENRFYAVSLRVLDVGYLFAFAEALRATQLPRRRLRCLRRYSSRSQPVQMAPIPAEASKCVSHIYEILNVKLRVCDLGVEEGE